MTDSNYLLSRQPIYGSSMNVEAYELRSNQVDEIDDAHIFKTFDDAGLDIFVGERLGLVALTPHDLYLGLWKSIPRSRVTLGYFRNFGPDHEAVRHLTEVARQGYQLALSSELSLETLKLLEAATNTIKLDVTRYTPDELERRVAELRTLKPRILAAKVDTYDDLEFCKSLEFDLYQGHFLSRPT